ncbi:MAG TPA: LLM class flavin-dependent oxidoreductase, partial [Gemmatimonadales bacterium]|nr:LLM class flavin-dependent oxidoreductase [Gemmatimonadales bacterium]
MISIGLFSINSHACATPEVAVEVAQLAEELGYDSVWAGEHVVLPSPRDAQSPMEPTEPILDPVVALTYVAAHTTRIRLGTGVIVLPQRNPLVLAKQVSSLDVLCGGRLILGIGVGYLRAELRALGVPRNRGSKTVEYLAAMRSLWDDPSPSIKGQYVEFKGIDAH